MWKECLAWSGEVGGRGAGVEDTPLQCVVEDCVEEGGRYKVCLWSGGLGGGGVKLEGAVRRGEREWGKERVVGHSAVRTLHVVIGVVLLEARVGNKQTNKQANKQKTNKKTIFYCKSGVISFGIVSFSVRKNK